MLRAGMTLAAMIMIFSILGATVSGDAHAQMTAVNRGLDAQIPDSPCMTSAERNQLRKMADEYNMLRGQSDNLDAQIEQEGSYREFREANDLLNRVAKRGSYKSSDEMHAVEAAKKTVARLDRMRRLSNERDALGQRWSEIARKFYDLVHAIEMRKCPPPAAADKEEERIEIGGLNQPWTGPYFGGSLGGRGTTDNVSNEGQVTFFLPDARPNPTASNSRTAFYGNVVVGYNSVVPLGGTAQKLLLGVEGFVGTGNNRSTMPGIPGTGGIATPAVAANDSTTVRETSDFGVLGRIGTFVPVGNSAVAVSFLGGVGFQRVSLDLNCTTAGACGTNGIPAQTLSTSKTMTGSLIGFEVGVPLASVLGATSSPGNAVERILRTANIRAQYLHGDFGHASATIGNPAQIQLTMDQKITSNTVTVGLVVPLSQLGAPVR